MATIRGPYAYQTQPVGPPVELQPGMPPQTIGDLGQMPTSPYQNDWSWRTGPDGTQYQPSGGVSPIDPSQMPPPMMPPLPPPIWGDNTGQQYQGGYGNTSQPIDNAQQPMSPWSQPVGQSMPRQSGFGMARSQQGGQQDFRMGTVGSSLGPNSSWLRRR